MLFENIKVIIITLFVIAVGAVLLNTEHKETLLLVIGVSALIFALTAMKGEKVLMGEG